MERILKQQPVLDVVAPYNPQSLPDRLPLGEDRTSIREGKAIVVWQSKERRVKDQKTEEHGRRYINTQITKARERLLQEITDDETSKRTYNIEFDAVVYHTLYQYRDLPGYEKARLDLDDYTKFQLETILGERFHTGLSTYTSSIRNGIIYADGMDEPMLDVLERGRLFRENHGSKDVSREEAEVVGFTKIQDILGDPEIPAGTMMLSISPQGGRGSIYMHNFYDIFLKRIDEEGNPFVEVNRYSSALSKQESLERVQEISPGYGSDEVVDDVYFLANPVMINAGNKKLKTSEDVHKLLHEEHSTMSEEEYREMLKICMPAILSYIEIMCDKPFDTEEHKLAFNAILNIADKVADILKEGINNTDDIFRRMGIVAWSQRVLGKEELFVLGTLPVRGVDTGCGFSGGFDLGLGMYAAGLPFSVGYFGAEIKKSCSECGGDLGDNHYHCPKNLKDKNGREGCGQSYKDETHKAIRTSECWRCGFKFGC